MVGWCCPDKYKPALLICDARYVAAQAGRPMYLLLLSSLAFRLETFGRIRHQNDRWLLIPLSPLMSICGETKR